MNSDKFNFFSLILKNHQNFKKYLFDHLTNKNEMPTYQKSFDFLGLLNKSHEIKNFNEAIYSPKLDIFSFINNKYPDIKCLAKYFQEENFDNKALFQKKVHFFPFEKERAKSKSQLPACVAASAVVSVPATLPLSEEEAFVARFAKIVELHPVYQLRAKANADLRSTGTLLAEAPLREVKENFSKAPILKLAKNPSQPHSVVASETGVLYAIYRSGKMGEGAYGKVKLAQNLTTKEFCVVKTTSDDRVLNEKALLARRGLLLNVQSRTNKVNRHKTYLFMRLVPGIRLANFIQLCKAEKLPIPSTFQAKILHSALNELRALYYDQIYHSDLHDHNILIDPLTMKISIIDYGNAWDVTDYKEKDGFHFNDIKRVCIELKNVVTDSVLLNILTTLTKDLAKPLVKLEDAMKAVLPHTISSMKQQLKPW
jgi:hypothetical protein